MVTISNICCISVLLFSLKFPLCPEVTYRTSEAASDQVLQQLKCPHSYSECKRRVKKRHLMYQPSVTLSAKLSTSHPVLGEFAKVTSDTIIK